jgi:hypothetical protein
MLKGVRERRRCDTKAAADEWEAVVSATGALPLDGTGASIKHPLRAVAKRARAEREDWKNSRDPSLDQRLEVVLVFFDPTSSLESVTYDKLLQFVAHLEKRKGAMGWR